MVLLCGNLKGPWVGSVTDGDMSLESPSIGMRLDSPETPPPAPPVRLSLAAVTGPKSVENKSSSSFLVSK